MKVIEYLQIVNYGKHNDQFGLKNFSMTKLNFYVKFNDEKVFLNPLYFKFVL